MLTVICCRFGTKYSRQYVEVLRNMVSRHLTIPYRFVCLTDDPTPISEVELIQFPNQNYARGWWHKVHLFNPEISLSGLIFYLDLDVVIHKSINCLIEGFEDRFMGIRDFSRYSCSDWNRLNSSVMLWTAGEHDEIYERFVQDPKTALKMHGDQDWIWHVAKSKISYWDDNWIQSYKWEMRNREDLIFQNSKRAFKNIGIPKIHPENCIAVFHGDPNPHEVQDHFVVDNWQ